MPAPPSTQERGFPPATAAQSRSGFRAQLRLWAGELSTDGCLKGLTLWMLAPQLDHFALRVGNCLGSQQLSLCPRFASARIVLQEVH